jgi:hypothetical protein
MFGDKGRHFDDTVVIGVMNQCAKCGVATNGGQFYRFYYGVFVDAPEGEPSAAGNRVDPGPVFHLQGSEEVYYCDRCLIQAAVWEEMIRSGRFLLLGLFAIVVVAFLVLAWSSRLWAGLVALVVTAALSWKASQRYRRLHAAARASNQDQLHQVIRSDGKIQNTGDEWAITQRRQALREEGAESFLTRRDYSFWSEFEGPV